jgi:hypothetical protein
MIRKTVIPFGLVLSLIIAIVSLNVSAAASHHHHGPPTTTTTSTTTSTTIPPTTTTTTQPINPPPGLLPGETTLSSGAPSFDFGTNDTVDYSEPSINELPSVQADIKAGGLTMMRVWDYSGGIGGGTDIQRAQVAKNSGTTCMFMLGSTDNLSWLETTVADVAPYCPYFEFGNEPSDLTTYDQQWNADIPTLRSIDPTGLFGGPAFFYTYVSTFLQSAKAAGVLPDFITWHDYPCEGYTSQSQCLSDTVTKFTADQNGALQAEQDVLGYMLPTGVSEYNFDAGSGTLGAWGDDANFMTQFTDTAIDTFVADHFAFACQFTTLNYSGYSYLDMFQDTAPYAPKPEFDAMVSEIQKYGGTT